MNVNVNEGWIKPDSPKSKAHYFLFTRQVASLCGKWEIDIVDYTLRKDRLAPADTPRCKKCARMLLNREMRAAGCVTHAALATVRAATDNLQARIRTALVAAGMEPIP